jgi:hypothetical protein
MSREYSRVRRRRRDIRIYDYRFWIYDLKLEFRVRSTLTKMELADKVFV